MPELRDTNIDQIQYLTIHFLLCGDSPHIFQRSVHFFMTYYLTISSFSKALKRCDCYTVCCFQNAIFYLWPYHKSLWPTAVWEKNHIVQHVIETSWWWNCKITLEIHIKLESLTLYLLSNLSINSRSPNDILSFFFIILDMFPQTKSNGWTRSHCWW